MSNIKLFGPHISKQATVLKTLEYAKNTINASAIQIFIGNPQSGRMTQKTVEKYQLESESVTKFLKQNNMCFVIHTPYVLNFSKDSKCDDPYWINELWNEIKVAQSLGSIGCVLHMGKAVSLDVNIAEKYMIDNIACVADKMADANMTTKIIIETSAGQGSELFATKDGNLQPIIRLWNSFTEKQKQYIGFCIDTCHIHSAGYKIDTIVDIDKLFDEWNNNIGINNLTVVHLNNSITPFNSHVDRHGTLTEGTIPTECLLHFAKRTFEYGIPIILETKGDPVPEIKMLHELDSGVTYASNTVSPIFDKVTTESSCCCHDNNEFNVENADKLIFIDLGYLFHYRFHATKRNMMFAYKNKMDELNNMDDNTHRNIFFTHLDQQLTKLFKKMKISKEHVFFCKDARKNTFWRTKLYPDYKANRGTFDPKYFEWLTEMYQHIKKYGNILELESSEADDLVYLSIKQVIHKYPNKEIIIYASDKDYCQTLDRPSIKLIDANEKEFIGTNYYDSQIHLWIKILTGDTADNIPPVVKGCGIKTAEKLLIDSNKFKQWATENNCREQIKLNRKLVSFNKIPNKYCEMFNKKYKYI
jgi:deoxyribonuclease-4